ncbi:MAG TPA: hypothetical protein VEW05_14470 [Candidatus Polarisedimenticolia bacterium]|nr:hypothetical protein [Candidatus Polarisedimenticolia bacterium]
MTSDASNLPKHVPTTLIKGQVAPPFDDPVAASLRVWATRASRDSSHRLDLCLQASERHFGAGVGLAVTHAMA